MTRLPYDTKLYKNNVLIESGKAAFHSGFASYMIAAYKARIEREGNVTRYMWRENRDKYEYIMREAQ